MARSEARLSVSIWTDDDFLDLGPGAQRLFMFLLSQSDLAHTGVIALRERRWARASRGLTTAMVADALAELHAARFVVLDEDAEELLIRSFIRRDKVYRQPNVLAAARDQVPVITSVPILAALAEELRRVAEADDVPAGSRKALDEMIAAVGNPTPKGSPNPPRGSTEGVAEDPPSDPPEASDEGVTALSAVSDGTDETAGPNPSGNPSAKGTPNPPGERGVVTDLVLASPSPVPRASNPDPRTPEPAPLRGGEIVAPLNAGQILAAWIDHCRANGVELSKRIKGRYAKVIKDALDEGAPPDRVKHALGAMLTECVVDTPGQLPRYLVRVQTGPARWPRRLTPGEQSVVTLVEQDAEVIDLASRFFERGTA